mgnify:CR=1 FL=1
MGGFGIARCGGKVTYEKRIAAGFHQDLIIRATKRSIDARGRKVKINVTVEVYSGQTPEPLISRGKDYHNVSNSDPIVIVGAGPTGLFAALRAIELGKKPIVLERGKDVRSRRRDLAALNKEHIGWQTIYPFKKKRRFTEDYGNFGCPWCQRRHFSGGASTYRYQ